MSKIEAVTQLNWNSPELTLVRPDAFPTFYPPKAEVPGLEQALKRIGGDTIECAYRYGSTVSGVAAKDSLMDIIVIVSNPWSFYKRAAEDGSVRLGTTSNPAFHSIWNYRKTNFHLGEINLEASKQRVKIAVISHGELSKHARGGRPEVETGKGYLYLAGRLHKAMLVPVFDETTKQERKEIDLAINQARIDGSLLALALMPRYFGYPEFAKQYVDLSYAADRRVDRAGKSLSLLTSNEEAYREMLSPILRCFIENDMIRLLDGVPNVYEVRMALDREDVEQWLKESASHAFRVNFTQNPLTMGIGTGIGYGVSKVLRSIRKSH